MISAEMQGDKLVVTRLETLPTALIGRVDATIGAYTLKLQRLALRNLSGVPVKEHTSVLKMVIEHGTFVHKTPWGIVGSVGATGASKKDAIRAGAVEYGSTVEAKIVQAVAGAKLRFQLPSGKFVFAAKVSIPAFKIPAHSFLRSALKEISAEAVTAIGVAAKIRDS